MPEIITKAKLIVLDRMPDIWRVKWRTVEILIVKIFLYFLFSFPFSCSHCFSPLKNIRRKKFNLFLECLCVCVCAHSQASSKWTMIQRRDRETDSFLLVSPVLIFKNLYRSMYQRIFEDRYRSRTEYLYSSIVLFYLEPVFFDVFI